MNVNPDTGLPRSYLVPEGYFDQVEAHLRPHRATEGLHDPQCGNDFVTVEQLDAYELQTETMLSTHGLNLYDGAVRTVALAWLGHFPLVDAYMTNTLLAHETQDFPDLRAGRPCQVIWCLICGKHYLRYCLEWL